MRPEPAIDEQRKFYDAWNTRWRNGTLAEIEPEIRVRAESGAELLRNAGLCPPSKILEIGCGTGWAADIFSELGELTGIDLSPAAIELAQHRVPHGHFMVGDFFAVPFDKGSFDAIIVIETLFYVQNQPAFVDRVAELLKPGGFLFVSTINKWVYERSGDVAPPKPGQIRNWLSIEETKQLFQPKFELLHSGTVAPRGRDGLLRVVNSRRIGKVLDSFGLDDFSRRMKERMGLGGGVLYLLSKKP